MKTLIIALLTTFTAAAHAEKPIDVTCLSAGGYYGNFRARQTSTGGVVVTAAQGFAHEISAQLGLNGQRALHEISFILKRELCTNAPVNGRVLACNQNDVQILGRTAQGAPIPLVGNIGLHINKGAHNGQLVHAVHLGVRLRHGFVQGSATVHFSNPLGGCLIK